MTGRDPYDSEALRQYRQKASDLGELRKQVGEAIGKLSAVEAQREFDKLTLQTKELEGLREQLTAKDLFMVKYNVTVINNHTVSCIIPSGCSRLEVLHEAAALVSFKQLVNQHTLRRWAAEDRFFSAVEKARRIHVDVGPERLHDRRREEQEAMIRAQGLTMPLQEDLAVAYAAFSVATDTPLFGRGYGEPSWIYFVRAANGGLYSDVYGLTGASPPDDQWERITAAVELPAIPLGK